MDYKVSTLRRWKSYILIFLIISFMIADVILGLNVIVKLEGQKWYNIPSVIVYIGLLLIALWIPTLNRIFSYINVYDDMLVEKNFFTTHKLYLKDIKVVKFEIRRGHKKRKFYAFYDKEGKEIFLIEPVYLENKNIRKGFFEFLKIKVKDIEFGHDIKQMIEN